MNNVVFNKYPKVNFADIKTCPHCGQTQEEHEGSSTMYQDNHALIVCGRCDGKYISYQPMADDRVCGYIVSIDLNRLTTPDRLFQFFADKTIALEYANLLINGDNSNNPDFDSNETEFVYYNYRFYGKDIMYAWNETSKGDKYMIRKINMDLRM